MKTTRQVFAMTGHIIDYSKKPPLTLEEWSKVVFNSVRWQSEVERLEQERREWETMFPKRINNLRYRIGVKIIQFGQWVGG